MPPRCRPKTEMHLTYSEVHNILQLYLTVPITSATSERSFSALKVVNTYLCSSVSEQRLDNCLLLHIYKDLTDSCDMEKVAKDFIAVNTERRNYFGVFPLVLNFLYSIVSLIFIPAKFSSCSAWEGAHPPSNTLRLTMA